MGNLCSNSKAVEQTTNTQDTGARDTDKTPQQKRYPYNWPAGAETVGYLTERQVKARMTMQSEQVLELPDGFKFRWAAVSQCFGQCLAAARVIRFRSALRGNVAYRIWKRYSRRRGYYPSQADKANQDAFAVHVS